MAILPASVRCLTPARLRDDPRLRAPAVGLGLIPPRTMHSPEDARVLLDAAAGARRALRVRGRRSPNITRPHRNL